MTRSETIDKIMLGDIKSALRSASKFDRIYSLEELRTLRIAYECLAGNEVFYKQIGHDTEKTINEAEALLKRMIKKNEQ